MKLLQNSFYILFISLFITLSGCKSYQSIIVEEPQNVKINSANLNNMNLTLQLPIKNPNFYPIKVKRIYADVYLNQNAVGKITNKEKLKIPGNSDEIHDLELNINYSDIFDSGFSLMRLLRSKKLQIKLEGYVEVRSFLIKKEVKFNESKAIEMNQ